MSRIVALRLGFIGLAIFAAGGLMRDWIAQLFVSGYDYRFVGVAQTIGFLMGCYGFYRFLVLGEVQKHKPVTRLKQSFHNTTDRPQIITLELSTARFRLNPGEVLVLHYDSDDALRIDFIGDEEGIELVVWTGETEMFLPDGRPAPTNYELL